MPGSPNIRWVCLALAGVLALAATAPAADAAKRKRTVGSELRKLLADGAIDQATFDADLAIFRDVKRRARRATGTRRAELRGVLATAQGMAARRQLRAGRLHPIFLTLQRNAEWWSSQPLPATGARVSFEGSELIWQYVSGQGLQIHPLANFGRLNALAKGSRRNNARNAQLLDELMAVAVPRGGGLAWEYYFSFDGGKPPWVSGLAQGTGLQAIARSGIKLGRLPELLPSIQRGLELFERRPPTGVRVETDAGVHYAQYSFWPDLRIVNGFIQSLVGLHDVAELTGDPRAAQLFADGEAGARSELPAFDTGAWSLYSRGAITRESDLHYHTLTRDFLAGLCDRTGTAVYCDAEARFTEYLTLPPELRLHTRRVRGGRDATLRFSLSKISRAAVTVTAPDGERVLSVAAGTVGRGTRSVSWDVPRKAGTYVVRVDATDLAGNPAGVEGPVRVLKPRKRGK